MTGGLMTGLRGWLGNVIGRRPAVIRGEDGFDAPTPELVGLIAGYNSPAGFLEDSRDSVGSLFKILDRNHLDLDRFGALLDFGCGCGRIVRGLHGLKHCQVHGTDYNPKLIDWCRKNLPFGQFGVNRLEPPLNYRDGQFDFVYSLSVFTHMTEQLQHAWAAELRRVLAPGGYLLITTHGERYLEHLNSEQRARYEAGEPIVNLPGEAGTNRCATFNPPQYVREKLLGGFEPVDFIPGGYHVVGHQDVHIVRKPA
jgi:SAM-dependent methyltransferase